MGERTGGSRYYDIWGFGKESSSGCQFVSLNLNAGG